MKIDTDVEVASVSLDRERAGASDVDLVTAAKVKVRKGLKEENEC